MEKNIFSELERDFNSVQYIELFEVFLSWFSLQEKKLEKNAIDWLESQLRDIDTESDKTEDGKKTSDVGKMMKIKELELEKFGGQIEDVIIRTKYSQQS